MTDITSSNSISSVMELANNVVESPPAEGFMSIVTKKFSENKMYVYIGIAVIVLGIVLYYFYNKNRKETKAKLDNKPKLELPEPAVKKAVEPSGNTNQNAYAGVPEISPDEYWVMDAQGRPVKVSGSFPQAQIAPLPIPKQAPSAGEIKMLQQQMLEQQMMQQKMMQQQMEQQRRLSAEHKAAQHNPKPSKKSQQKIQHPEESEDDASDDIDIELARINANEDENVAQHNLTNSELAEITKKLEVMGSQLGSVQGN
jgi:hypothetical protein